MSYAIKLGQLNKRVNSTARPDTSGWAVYDCALKTPTDLDSPTVTINTGVSGEYPAWTYGYIAAVSGYFWVTAITAVRAGVYEVTLELDPLATYKPEILATSAVILYSASDYSMDITDNRMPVMLTKERKTALAEYKVMLQTGCYLLATCGSSSGQSTQSFSTIYAVTAGALASIAAEFNTAAVLEQLKQWFDDPLSTIIFCKWVPIDGAKISGGVAPIRFGDYGSGASGGVVKSNYYYETVKLAIPWPTEDYRKVEPYSTGSLYLPGVGDVNLPLAPLYGLESLTVTMCLDVVSGAVHYTVEDTASSTVYGTYSGGLAVDIPVTSVQSSNIGGVLSGLGTAMGGVATVAATVATGGAALPMIGGTIAAAAGLAQLTGASVQQSVKSSGTFAGGYSVWSGGTAIRLEIQRSLSVQDPEGYRARIGNPCGKNRTINGLSGYCQTAGFSVSGNMRRTEKDQINALMDGGVYIE